MEKETGLEATFTQMLKTTEGFNVIKVPHTEDNTRAEYDQTPVNMNKSGITFDNKVINS